MFDRREIQVLQFLEAATEQQPKKMRFEDICSPRKRRVHFQAPEADSIVHYERLPLHEGAELWYCRGELKAIHKEIFVSLMEVKNGNLSDFQFSARGLEEIRKRKPHKRQMRRKEYIASVVALSREQRQNGMGHVLDEELRDFAVSQSRSATLRAQHYAALDLDEARLVYQETFQPRNTLKTTEATAPRRVPCPAPPAMTTTTDSIARSA
ncbi:expressed unknown protein [Seminavis robusta]|uniref:Uncharacterized protein n=1 Tax=Seminavis robusta TaxID=568900 RepID=A0A9N8F039_9STRA|nr:expressed unknown protein [Seminavis robusta]|eukprot:Sro2866_g338970.1 n/a (210) ;mRNA; r:5103-5732